MSLALFGFDELEAKLYYLNTGKHISENLTPRRPRNDSSSSSVVMDEESTNQCDARMEEDIDNITPTKEEVDDTSVEDNVKMTEDVSDDSLSVANDPVEDMEVGPEYQPDETKVQSDDEPVKSSKKKVSFAPSDVAENCGSIGEREPDTSKEESGSENATSTASHEDTISETPTEVCDPATVTCPTSETCDEIPTVPEPSSQESSHKSKTEPLSDEAAAPAQMETDQASNVGLEEKIENSKGLDILDSFLKPKEAANYKHCNGDVHEDSSNSTNNTSDNSTPKAKNPHESPKPERKSQMQQSCKQCYVKLHKIHPTPVIERPVDLLKSCKDCYVRLNKLHLNDLLLSCRQCSVVVPRLTQRLLR